MFVDDLGNLMQGFAVALTWKNLVFMSGVGKQAEFC